MFRVISLNGSTPMLWDNRHLGRSRKVCPERSIMGSITRNLITLSLLLQIFRLHFGSKTYDNINYSLLVILKKSAFICVISGK